MIGGVYISDWLYCDTNDAYCPVDPTGRASTGIPSRITVFASRKGTLMPLVGRAPWPVRAAQLPNMGQSPSALLI